MLKCEYGKLLAHCTSLKIGGPVFCWLEPENFEDVLEAILVAENNKKTLAIIGHGTNLLAQDSGFNGVVIRLGRGFDYIEKEKDEIVRIGASAAISRLVKQAADWGLGGCEFLSGIPGSFGGAVFMNAGVRDIKHQEIQREIKDIILDIDVIDLKDKKRKSLERHDIYFAYRSSGLDGKCILGGRIKLKKDDKDIIDNQIDSFMKKREWIRGLGFPSVGSVFKNPATDSPAGRLIESCGLKGKRIGGAEISRLHANFIVNTGSAMSKDVLNLMELAKKSVKERFDIELEREIRII